ncbi:MAG: MBL fold metallo-hydrolase [Candidatus Woesearchaeota archaeon]|jgi:putative mRNA 3-end processing factor|nr:MBL fold metallo-hydrolase [Candidatus Woesearchaeota archaeon]
MKIIFHGAAREVGKSCIEIQSEGKRYLLDAGVKFIPQGIEYPKYLDKIHDLDGLFLSHAHLDHSGALPMLEHKQLNCPIYTTDMTWRIVNMLLADSYHLEKLKHLHPAYSERDIKAVEQDLKFVTYDKEYTTKDGKIKFQYLNAGHIPGSASILMQIEGKTVLYTGDINTEDTNLMIPSNLDKLQNEVDILITENTYGDRRHPDRVDAEEGIIKSIESCVKEGGSALVPVFGVGRSQEVLIILNKLDLSIPIYLDGMARKLTEHMVKSDDPYIDNKDILDQMFKRAIKIKSPREREDIAKKKGIVILTTSGMVQGGPVVSYMGHYTHVQENFIILTGYQAKGTNGRSIFEDHTFYTNHHREKVVSHVRKFDFSAHYGQDSIHNLIEKIKPKSLILQHGDLEAIEAVRNWAKENTDAKVYDPYIGEELDF